MSRFTKEFYTRDVLLVAPNLLGQYLVRRFSDGTVQQYIVTEVEAYSGRGDLACHASKGKTERTSIMFSEGGCAYIYLIYGKHWMLNVVTGSFDNPQAVLVRGLKDCYGPGRLTRMLKIDKDYYGEDFTTSQRLWFEPSNIRPQIHTGPRIGVDYAGEYWSSIPWRYWIDSDTI
jgi:DNA-3-methyladenine glycosylase